jgi:hypothetical protein
MCVLVFVVSVYVSVGGVVVCCVGAFVCNASFFAPRGLFCPFYLMLWLNAMPARVLFCCPSVGFV